MLLGVDIHSFFLSSIMCPVSSPHPQILHRWIQPTVDWKHSKVKILESSTTSKTWICHTPATVWAAPGASAVKNLPANVGKAGSIPGLGKSPGVGNGNAFQYCYLGNPMDRGSWWATVHGVAKNRTQLSDFHFVSFFHELETSVYSKDQHVLHCWVKK